MYQYYYETLVARPSSNSDQSKSYDSTIQPNQSPNPSKRFRGLKLSRPETPKQISAAAPHYSPQIPNFSISFKNVVEGLIEHIFNNIPSMPQYEFSDKRMGILAYGLFLHNMDAFIQHIIGKHFLFFTYN